MMSTADSAAQTDAEIESLVLRQAVATCAPSIVRIETTSARGPGSSIANRSTVTTGVIVSSDGHIITSSFAFVSDPGVILVTLEDGSRIVARRIATDHSRKLVLLKVDAEQELTVPEWAPREELRIGQSVVAVGRVFQGSQPNVSYGILSATHRIWGKAVQCDAKISPNNYGGPLLDYRGRVIGILGPHSHRSDAATAGAEWYDSGIGFAIPMSDWISNLERLRDGHDLFPGKMGINLLGNNLNSDPAIIGACPAGSPSHRAGLRAGDEIVAIDGMPIERQGQFFHLLRPKYAGTQIQVSARRDGELLSFDVELVETIEPYEKPLLGIVPFSTPTEGEGVAVRFVYPDSPADLGGVQAGDRLDSIHGTPVDSIESAHQVLANLMPGESIEISFTNADGKITTEVQLANSFDALPDQVPPRNRSDADAGAGAAEVVTIKLPEEADECHLLIPPTYAEGQPHGLLVWIGPPNADVPSSMTTNWQTIAAEHHFLVLAPVSSDGGDWEPTDMTFIRRSVEDVRTQFQIDDYRIVVGGYQSGGSLAILTAFAERDLFRGTVTVDSPIDSAIVTNANEPLLPLNILSLTYPDSQPHLQSSSILDQLQAARFPVIRASMNQDSIDTQERELIGRWIDLLEQF